MMYAVRRIQGILMLLLLPLAVLGQSKDNIKRHTEFLSSDLLEGRGTGSKGIRLASKYIGEQFEAIGLQPIKDDSYFQEFPYPDKREMESNVIGVIRAASPSNKSIVFTAHYDAYGIISSDGQQDSICNGAQDNAVGVAALIEIARIYAKEKAPEHNLVFAATAGEEFGHHGSKYYVNNPVYPSDQIIICLNIDGFNVSGPREDFFVFPRQGIDFVDKIKAILKPSGWHYSDVDWVDNLNTNFDTASFLEKGIPALTIWTGNRLKGGEIAKPLQLGAIHSPEDEITSNWNWNGVEDHVLLYKAISDYFLERPENLNVIDPALFSGQ